MPTKLNFSQKVEKRIFGTVPEDLSHNCKISQSFSHSVHKVGKSIIKCSFAIG